MALFVDLVALSNGLHGSVQMDSVALFSWIGWLRHHGILSFTVYFNMFNLRYTILIVCFVSVCLFQKHISCESLSYKDNEAFYQILIFLMLVSIELMTLNFNQFKWLRKFLSVMFDIKISSNFFVKIRYVEIILKTFIEYKSISIIGSEIMNKNEYRHQLFEEYISLVLLHISLTFFSFL